jgi:hypothetical protein
MVREITSRVNATASFRRVGLAHRILYLMGGPSRYPVLLLSG